MNNRKELEERLIQGMSFVLNEEQHKMFTNMIHKMSDEEFERMKTIARQTVESSGKNPESLKDFLNFQKDILMSNSDIIPYTNCSRRLEFLSEDKNSELWTRINQSKPTSLIDIQYNVRDILLKLWKHENKVAGVPSDIFFSGSIPLMDINVDYEFEFNHMVKFRIVIYPDYQEIISNTNEQSTSKIGALILEVLDGKIATEIEVAKGVDCLMTSALLGYKMNSVAIEDCINNMPISTLASLVGEFISIWYGIQIALLHPVIKNIFKNPQRVEDESRKKKSTKNGKKKKSPIKYIKKHVISVDRIERVTSSTNYNRHSLCWYVMGHWRTYKNGKRIFIKPYWKGILRDTKTVDEIREREIVTES